MTGIEIVLMTWPNSYERVAYLCSVIDSLKLNLRVDGLDVKWKISSELDESQSSYFFGDELAEIANIIEAKLCHRSGPANVGNHINFLLRNCECDYILLLHDDRILDSKLDLAESVELMENHDRIGAIWYDWLPPGESTWGRLHGFHLISFVSLWVLGDRQMLLRRDFGEQYGYFLEDCRHGDAETDMNCRMRRYGVTIVRPHRCQFKHIGHVRTIHFGSKGNVDA